MQLRPGFSLVAIAALVSAAHAAAPQFRNVEIMFTPAANLQMAVWVEDAAGNYVDTVYITRLTGSLGLANRPGNGFFKSDFRAPYGRREMVLPVWAHRRNHPYGRVYMGGKWGYSPTSCTAAGIAGSECDDQTIGYHFMVSSTEPFFCSPRGGIAIKQNGVDVVTCASSFYGSKGAYRPGETSLYPPRADLTSFQSDHDGPDAIAYSTVNDLGAVSGATPPGNQPLSTPLRWTPPPSIADGAYVLKIEAHLEADFNTFHRYPSQNDGHSELNGYGRDFLGQPSIIYSVPFTLGPTVDVELTSDYEGYSDWDGSTGTLHPADMTISTVDGTGAGRLMMMTDQSGSYRVKVSSLPSDHPTCDAPGTPTGLQLTPGPSSITLDFASAQSGVATARFDVRYREKMPITEADFLTALPPSSSPPAAGQPGSAVSTLIGGLRPDTKYYVAVRALSTCDAASSIVTASVSTKPASFVTLNGCFIATAAYGTPMATEIDGLRRLRDRHLLTNPAGQLLVALYYAFSPSFANAIAGDDFLRAKVRGALAPLVSAVH